jgi:Uncharacterized protein involved in exopolysaccharide biosynthesis
MQQAPVTKPHEQDDDNDEIDLMGLLGTLIDHKWLIASVTGVFMAAGVAYALLATPVYQANALIQVEAKRMTCWASPISAACWAKSRLLLQKSS